MPDLFANLQPQPAPLRIAVARVLADGMTRPLRDIAACAGITEPQARTELQAMLAESQAEAMPDCYWSLTPRGIRWIEEVRDA